MRRNQDIRRGPERIVRWKGFGICDIERSTAYGSVFQSCNERFLVDALSSGNIRNIRAARV